MVEISSNRVFNGCAFHSCLVLNFYGRYPPCVTVESVKSDKSKLLKADSLMMMPRSFFYIGLFHWLIKKQL